jgi:predicted DNA-binding mobile mystery protein A
MTTDLTRLKRTQTEEMLRPYRPLAQTATPRGGWVRAIREALGMSAAQLAERLGVIRQSVEAYERNEANGKITLESLNKIAGAMNCRLVYALVPEKPLEQIQRDRAEVLANELVKPVSHSMKLEAQAISEREARRQREQLVQALLQGNPKKLWD